MKRPSLTTLVASGAALVVAGGLALGACQNTGSAGSATARDAASRVYVPPGEHDELYAILSGGYSGQLTVYGIPSGRLIKTIGVFSQHAENGYGYSEETKQLLNSSYGLVPWDDTHHTSLSMTDGLHDGRWVFVNANNTPRVARIDLTTFSTTETLELPNSAGNHGSPYLTANSEYLVASTRFSVPIAQADVPISNYSTDFKGTISFVRADQPGKMDVAFQILMPGFNYDLARAGKGPSADWVFLTSYNTEQANTLLEVNASQNDKDYIAAINWKRAEACVAEGKATDTPGRYLHNYVDDRHIAVSEEKTSTKTLLPENCAGAVYFLPTPKSPHGVDVDPTGEQIVGSGKLAATLTVFSFSKMLSAIERQSHERVDQGIPVLKYEDILAGEVKEPGLGPLHTEFDGKGFAYTTMFISSEVVKWSLADYTVVDRMPVFYSVGHLMIPGGDTRQPFGKYVVAMNKITKDRYLPTGPELAHAAQLIDITGDKMQMLLDFPTMGEPHYAQAIEARLIKDRQVKSFPIAENRNPYAVKGEGEVRVERQGNDVHVYMSAIRSHFAPDNIEGVQVGDNVYFHVTNLEQDWDVPHGFAITGMQNAGLLVMPGETRTIVWRPDRVGVFPMYCTDFCSALHQEMQGYVRVSPRGQAPALAWHTGKTAPRAGGTTAAAPATGAPAGDSARPAAPAPRDTAARPR